MSHGADTRVGEGGGFATTALFFLASAGVVEWPGGARWLTDGGPRQQREGAMRRARVQWVQDHHREAHNYRVTRHLEA